MSDIIKKIAEGNPNTISVDEIRRNAQYIREKVLDDAEVDITKTAPNVFGYQLSTDSIGLNEISNVDMGYAGTSIDFAGEQLSKRNPYIKELEYNVSLMRDSENAIVILNGGLFSYIPKSLKGEMLSYQDQIAYFYSLFKDLADQGKIVAMVRGTEEHRILKNHRVDPMDILQEALGLEQKVCNDALINVELSDDIVGKANVGIRTINWNNSATTGAYIGRKMEERAVKRGGADIYLARTTMNYFKTAVGGERSTDENNGSPIIQKPIYLISGGSYTPFKGAMTAGAEYNSIKDNELPPSSFWYKVTVEERQNVANGERPYIVRVNPIQYVAHQINMHGTDKLVAGIENEIEKTTNSFIQNVVDDFASSMQEPRTEGRQRIREILLNNKKVDKENQNIRDFIASRHRQSKEQTAEPEKTIVDLGANVPVEEPKVVIDGQVDCMEQE